MRTPVTAGALTALVAGGTMAVLASSTGSLAATLPGIGGLTAVLVLAGVIYGLLIQSGRLKTAFGSGIIYWTVAFPVARLIFEVLAPGTNSRSGLADGVMGFLIFQALVGGGFGFGFVLVHSQITGLLEWLGRQIAARG
jgi:hypothetical protein